MSGGPLIRPISRRQWWLGPGRYRRYMARELTSLFIGAYAFMLIQGLWRFSQGAEAFATWLEATRSPLGLGFNILLLVAALYHSFTWFNVAPKAISVRFGTSKLPDSFITGAHYSGWLLISILLFLLVRF